MGSRGFRSIVNPLKPLDLTSDLSLKVKGQLFFTKNLIQRVPEKTHPSPIKCMDWVAFFLGHAVARLVFPDHLHLGLKLEVILLGTLESKQI